MISVRMSDDSKKDPGNLLLEVESTDRWISDKGEEELIHDLKVYLARLRDNPRSIPDRLKVAGIQLHLGRTQEALIHYEGVLRGYVEESQILNAIALCKRILKHYPQLPRIQRIMAALYARAPHGATGAASPVEPISSVEEQSTTHFVLEAEEDEEITDRNMVVNRVFPAVRRTSVERLPPNLDVPREDKRPTTPYEAPFQPDDYVIETLPEIPEAEEPEPEDGAPVLLTSKKTDHEPRPPVDEDDGELVVLLTKKKKKK